MNMISFNNLEGTLWAEVEKSEDSALLENDFANIVAKALSVSGRGNRGYRLIAMSE